MGSPADNSTAQLGCSHSERHQQPRSRQNLHFVKKTFYQNIQRCIKTPDRYQTHILFSKGPDSPMILRPCGGIKMRAESTHLWVDVRAVKELVCWTAGAQNAGSLLFRGSYTVLHLYWKPPPLSPSLALAAIATNTTRRGRESLMASLVLGVFGRSRV